MAQATPGGDHRTDKRGGPIDAGLYAAPVASVFAALLLAALLFQR